MDMEGSEKSYIALSLGLSMLPPIIEGEDLYIWEINYLMREITRSITKSRQLLFFSGGGSIY
jgi:hypothetical protein